uniref:Uncharacterized protein n=1 Tax=Mesocestoides corti TaxID=53468 RepID=A0A5K3FHL5_MESCO
MSASQLLRLKRLHDDQPQLSTATPTSAEPLHQPSQAPKLPAPSHTKFPAADPSAGAVCQAQQLPHSVEVVVPPAVGGSASGGGDDDGTDFELNSLLHLQRPVRNAPGQQLAEHYRLLQGAHLLAGHKAVAHPVKSGPPPAFLQQQRRFNHPPPGMLQYVATTGFPQPPVKRPVIPTLTTTAAAATPPRPFDSSTNSLLTGRSVVSTTTVVTSAASTATPRRPIVHKYHSFRKISPKHQSTAAATAATGNRPASTTVSKPASSQLLKSLLESGGGSSLPRTPSTAAAVPMVTAAPATTTFNQPAHQSRGTWQLGGRAIVLGASITTPSTPLSSSAHRLQAASQPAPALTSPKTDVIPSDSVPQAVLHENDKPETRQDSTETVGS